VVSDLSTRCRDIKTGVVTRYGNVEAGFIINGCHVLCFVSLCQVADTMTPTDTRTASSPHNTCYNVMISQPAFSDTSDAATTSKTTYSKSSATSGVEAESDAVTIAIINCQVRNFCKTRSEERTAVAV
jgi:hypothetical protein